MPEADRLRPPARELPVVEDSRTTPICRRLADEAGRGAVLPRDHAFWKTHGFPPYHFQCRTSVRPVFQAELDAHPPATAPVSRFAGFHPAEGFGGTRWTAGRGGR